MTNSWHIHDGFLFCGFLFLTGCGSVVRPYGSTAADVYLAGFEAGTSEVATYWKNGVKVALTDGTYGAYADGIAVSGNDVHVVGNEESANGHDIAMYWKNGVPTQLTDGTKQGYATGIALSGSDVYISGSENSFDPSGNLYSVAEYWKNGVPVVVSGSSSGASALAILVSGTDVYVAGWENKTTQTGPSSYVIEPVAKYWKNGVAVALTDGSTLAEAFSIFVLGNDVYVSGINCLTTTAGCERAALWKNGKLTQLETTDPSTASSVFVAGSDVYISENAVSAATNLDVAELWKNNADTTLAEDVIAAANQVVISGGDVYVAGAWPLVGYWKNGSFVSVARNNNISSAYAIAVVPR
jgi:hypothetical protein